jgi:hypothetical protein
MSYGAQMMLRKVEAALHRRTARSTTSLLEYMKIRTQVASELGRAEEKKLFLEIVDLLTRLRDAEEAMVPRDARR